MPPRTAAAAVIAEDVPDVGPMLAWDARFARHLEGIGPKGGKPAAERVRDCARQDWINHAPPEIPGATLPLGTAAPEPGRLWGGWFKAGEGGNPDRYPALELLAVALWADVVGPEVERVRREVARLHQPAMPRGALEATGAALFAGDRTLEHSGGQVTIWHLLNQGKEVAHLDRDRLERTRRRGVAVSETAIEAMISRTHLVTAHQLFRHLAAVAFDRYVNRPEGHPPNPRYRVEHGRTGLARRIGAIGPNDVGGEAVKILGEVLTAWDILRIPVTPSQWSTLLRISGDGESKRGPAVELVLDIGDVMFPGFVDSLPDATRSERAQRRLIPIPAALPPFIGGDRTHGRQAFLQQLVFREYADRAEEYMDRGGLVVDEWLVLLADEAGLEKRWVRANLEDMRNKWIADPEAPVLVPVEGKPGRFDLAPIHHAAKALIIETAEIHLDSARRGRASAEKRARARSGGRKGRKS